MRCPYCAHPSTRVINSRPEDNGREIRRRRECQRCERRFTTFERIELSEIIKRNGRRQTYDRTKVLTGITKACEKRDISTHRVEEIADQVERAIIEMNEREVSSAVIGDEVMKGLSRLDQVAYVRYASYYKIFQDATAFMEQINKELKAAQAAKKRRRKRKKDTVTAELPLDTSDELPLETSMPSGEVETEDQEDEG